VSHRESASARAFSLVKIYKQCSSISWSAMCMAICRSVLIARPSVLSFACTATTSWLWQCSLILQALDSVVQVCSVCTTAYSLFKLMFLASCHCGTVVLKHWASVCMLDTVSPCLRKLPPIPFCPDVSAHSPKICCGCCGSRIPFHCERKVSQHEKSCLISEESQTWRVSDVVVRAS
jgi:hypothetical protein